MPLPNTDQMAILERLRTARCVVILSGAGLSAESGIPTFRDANNSLWANIDPMVVASLDGFNQNPDKVWAWHKDMRSLFASAGPNAGHEGIALLEVLLQPAQVKVITQNIDGFHQAAGSSWVAEIHGNTTRIRCHRHCGYTRAWDDDVPQACPSCGARVRPDVVWFGETLDESLFEVAVQAAEEADVFFTVGTSGIVQPAASLTGLACASGAMVIEVNPGQTPHSTIADYTVRASATEFFQSLCKTLKAMKLSQLR